MKKNFFMIIRKMIEVLDLKPKEDFFTEETIFRQNAIAWMQNNFLSFPLIILVTAMLFIYQNDFFIFKPFSKELFPIFLKYTFAFFIASWILLPKIIYWIRNIISYLINKIIRKNKLSIKFGGAVIYSFGKIIYIIISIVCLLSFYFYLTLSIGCDGFINPAQFKIIEQEFFKIKNITDPNKIQSLSFHFQNLYFFYIPLSIAWFSTLIFLRFALPESIKNQLRNRNIKKTEVRGRMSIYLLYFFRLIAIQYPFPFFIGIFVNSFLFLFSFMSVLTPNFFSIFERLSSFSGNIAYPSFLFSTIALYITPIIYCYFNIEDTFETYSAIHSNAKILSRFDNHFIILGYGNLGRRVINHVLKNSFIEKKKIPTLKKISSIFWGYNLFNNQNVRIKKELRSQINILVDNNLKLKIVLANFVVINAREDAFNLVYTKKLGIHYGFLPIEKNENIWLMGIPSNASNLYVLEEINYKHAQLIINATSNQELPIKIFEDIKDKKSILAVQDSAIFHTLLRNSYDKNIFLIFPTLIGCASIANMIFLFIEKIIVEHNINNFNFFVKNHKNVLAQNKVLIIGEGRGFYYVLERFKSLLKHEISLNENRIDFFNRFFILLSNDKVIEGNSKFTNVNKKRIWEINLDRYEDKIGIKYQIPVYFDNPFSFEAIKEILINPEFGFFKKERIGLIVIFRKDPYESLKLLMTVRYVFESLKDNKHKLPLILISSPHNEMGLIKKELEVSEKVFGPQSSLFPTQKNMQLVHDYLVADEVSAIFGAWAYENNKNQYDPFLLTLCIRDIAGTLLKCLLLLSGMNIDKIYFDENNKIPSFHVTNSLVDKKNLDSYVFEGIASLTFPQNSNNFIHGIFINSSNYSIEKINELLAKLVLSPLKSNLNDQITDFKQLDHFGCPKFCSICPISIIANEYDLERTRVPRRIEKPSDTQIKPYFERLFLYKDSEHIEDKAIERQYAKIWVYGEKASIPGALAIGLKDLLMVNWEALLPNDSELNTEVFDVKYLTNVECPEKQEYTVRNIYMGTIKINRENQIKELKKGTLKVVCIKTANLKTWEKYMLELKSFLENEYRKEYFFDNILNRKFPYCFLLIEKKQNKEFLLRTMRKIDVFWNTQEIEQHIDEIKNNIEI